MARKKGKGVPNPQLSRALLAGAVPIPDPNTPEKPDWSLWGEKVDANVQDITVLSCDVAPEWFRHSRGRPSPFLKEFFRRKEIIRSHIDAGAMPGAVSRPTGLGRAEIRIALRTFADWAEAREWRLPDDFPGVREIRSRGAPVVVPAEPARDDGTPAQIPHRTRTLSALFEIMRKHWTNYDPKNPPKQTVVAGEIDDALGWSRQKDGKPSRNADALAAAIRPDSLVDADPRARGRRRDGST